MTVKKNGAALLKWLPIILLAGGGSVAWGVNLNKISEHERRLIINEKTIKELSESRGRVDERTKAILRSQKNTAQNIRAILRQLERRPVR